MKLGEVGESASLKIELKIWLENDMFVVSTGDGLS
jgi:hypothetical protein